MAVMFTDTKCEFLDLWLDQDTGGALKARGRGHIWIRPEAAEDSSRDTRVAAPPAIAVPAAIAAPAAIAVPAGIASASRADGAAKTLRYPGRSALS
jgi:hypothetical protein